MSFADSSVRLRRNRRGVAAVEAAILLPLLCFSFLVTIDFCRVFYYSVAVSNCARNGAIYGSADLSHALDTAGIAAASKIDASNLDLERFEVQSSTQEDASGNLSVDVTVTYPFETITHYPGIPERMTLNRTVRMSVLPPTPSFP